MTIGARAASSSTGLPRGLFQASGLAAVIGTGLAYGFGGMSAALVAAGALGVVLLLIGLLLPGRYPHARFGLCNLVTLARAALVAGLIGLLWVGVHGWVVFAVATLGLALDGVDGWLARKAGLSSAFGARFDMETDAALALVLAAHVWVAGMTGAEILILGVMRYVFVLGVWPFPWLSAALPERFGRKLVCVFQIAALILLQVPDLPRGVALMIAWPAVAALIWSFGRDTLWLLKNRA